MSTQVQLSLGAALGVPPRPQRRDPAVVAAVAEGLAPYVLAWCRNDGTKIEDITADLKSVLSAGYGDGYSRARELDNKGYSPDAELVDILDSADFYGVVARATEAWVIANDIKAQFAVGATVKTPHGIGQISDIRAEQAEYLVKIEGHSLVPAGTYGGTVIAFERAEAVTCDHCEALIDPAADPDCVVDTGNMRRLHQMVVICEPCREKAWDQQEERKMEDGA